MMRGAVLLLLFAGCSSESVAPPPDLAVSPPDLAADQTRCRYATSNLSDTVDLCYVRFCRSPASDALDIYSVALWGPEMDFTINGGFTLGRSYTATDLTTFSGQYLNTNVDVRYSAGNDVAGSTVTLNITDVEWSANDACPTLGIAHGTAHVVLIESLPDGGTTVPVPMVVDATF
jgi:hypothetical protein